MFTQQPTTPLKMPTVEFTSPTIGPKVYVSRGPSGWPETFNREQADQQLRAFIVPIELDELVNAFVVQRTIAEKPEPSSWGHITHYLARNLSVHAKAIPDAVGIAFWAHVNLALIAAEADAN